MEEITRQEQYTLVVMFSTHGIKQSQFLCYRVISFR